jgi:hypothetical protein
MERLKEIGTPPKLHIIMIRPHKKVISNMQCNNKWSMDINCKLC